MANDRTIAQAPTGLKARLMVLGGIALFGLALEIASVGRDYFHWW